MPAFNPDTADSGVTNFSGFSRGAEPDRSFETVFTGLGQIGNAALKMNEERVSADIYQQADQLFQATNEEFGVVPQNPPGMNEGLDKMVVLQKALEQGKISQVNYYGRLATLTKQLRTKYPGYEQVVDSTIQSVTGTRPANAYRDAIFAELNSVLEGQSDQDKFRRQYEKENEGVINLVLGDEYFKNPDAFDFTEVRSKVSKFKGTIEQIDAEAKELQLMSSRGEFNDKKAKRLMDRDFAFTTSAIMSRSLNLNGPTAMGMIDDFVQKGGASGEQLDQFIAQVSELEATTRAELTKLGRERYVVSGLSSAQDMNAAIDQAMYPITEAKKAVLGGDFKLAARMATVSKSIQDQSLNDLLVANPKLKIGAGLTEINQSLGDMYFSQTMSDVGTIGLEMTGQIMLGEEVVKPVVESGNSKASRKMIETSFQALTDGNISGEKFSNLVQQYFGANAIDFMSAEVVKAEDLKTVYMNFLRPEVTAAIAAKGSPEDKAAYTEWALTKAAAIPEFRQAAGNTSDLAGTYAFQLDPKTLQIVVGENPYADGQEPGGMGSLQGRNPRAIQRKLSDINSVLRTLKPIFEMNGVDPATGAVEFLNGMSIQLNGGIAPDRRTGILEGAIDSYEPQNAEADVDPVDEIDFIKTAVVNGGRRTTPSGGSDPQTNDLLDMIGQAEGAGYDTIYGYNERKYGVVPTEMTISEVQNLQKEMASDLGSSAVGKYQIMRQTLKDAVKALGLSGSEVFTPELQDMIATEFLLKRRGYDKFRSGDLSNRKFLDNLSQEWASVPTSGGLSYYNNDRMGNKASKGGRAIAKMLDG